MITEDKFKHALVSATIAVLLSLFLPWWEADVVGIIIGVL